VCKYDSDCYWLIPGWRGRVMQWRLVSSSGLRLMTTVAHCVSLVRWRQWWSSTVPYWWASTQHAFTGSTGRMQQTCTRRCSLKTKQWSFQTYTIHSTLALRLSIPSGQVLQQIPRYLFRSYLPDASLLYFLIYCIILSRWFLSNMPINSEIRPILFNMFILANNLLNVFGHAIRLSAAFAMRKSVSLSIHHCTRKSRLNLYKILKYA